MSNADLTRFKISNGDSNSSQYNGLEQFSLTTQQGTPDDTNCQQNGDVAWVNFEPTNNQPTSNLQFGGTVDFSDNPLIAFKSRDSRNRRRKEVTITLGTVSEKDKGLGSGNQIYASLIDVHQEQSGKYSFTFKFYQSSGLMPLETASFVNDSFEISSMPGGSESVSVEAVVELGTTYPVNIATSETVNVGSILFTETN